VAGRLQVLLSTSQSRRSNQRMFRMSLSNDIHVAGMRFLLFSALPLVIATAAAALGGCSAATTEEASILPIGGGELSSRSGAFGLTVTPAAKPQVGKNALAIAFARPTSARITAVRAFMPAHGHAADAPRIVALSDDKVRVEDLVLFMPGRWEVTFDLASVSVENALPATDTVRFNVLVE
jgi:hypothetical protein